MSRGVSSNSNEMRDIGARGAGFFLGSATATGTRSIVLLTILAWLVSGGRSVADSAPDSFSAQRAGEHLRRLAERIGPRPAGSRGEFLAGEAIASHLSGLGMEVSRLEIGRMGEDVVGSQNVLGVQKGPRPDVILISAHHDTSDADCPGARDNASGVAVLLEAARVLSIRRPASSLWFVAFGAEEHGLIGSRHFASTNDLSSVKAVINLDAVGGGSIIAAPLPDAPPLWASRALEQARRRDGLSGVDLDPLLPLVARTFPIRLASDHLSFLRWGIPSVTLAGRARDGLAHTRLDTAERVDPAALESAGRALLGMVAGVDDVPRERLARQEDRRYVILPAAGLAFFVVTPALRLMPPLAGIAWALWWRQAGRRAWRRGTRIDRRDAVRALLNAALPLLGAIAGWAAASPAGAPAGLALGLAGFSAGRLAVLGMAAPHRCETALVAGAGAGTLSGALLVLAGRPDVAFYLLGPAVAGLVTAAWSPRLAPAGAVAGSLPILSLWDPRHAGEALAAIGTSWPLLAGPTAALALLLPTALMIASAPGSHPGSRRAWRAGLALGLLAGGAFILLPLLSPVSGRRPPRIVRLAETIPLAGDDRFAAIRLIGASAPGGVRLTAGSAGPLVLRAGGVPSLLPLPAALADWPEPSIRLEPAADAVPGPLGVVADLIVSAPMPAEVERSRITLHSLEPFRMLDEGIWLRASRFRRGRLGLGRSAGGIFRLAGQPGQRIDVEIEADSSSDQLDLRSPEEAPELDVTARLTWSGWTVL